MVTDTLNPAIGLPDMGDFYYDAPDQESYFSEMDKNLNSIRRDRANTAEAYKFYQEDPPQPGADEQGKVFVFDVALGGKGISDDDETVAGIKVDDGDTLAIPVDSIRVADEKSEKYLSYVKGYISTHNSNGKATAVNVRFAGLDTKELPHFRKVDMAELNKKEVSTIGLAEAMGNSNYVVSKYKSWMQARKTIDKAYDGYATKGTFFEYAEPGDSTVTVVKLDDGKYYQYFSDGTNGYVLAANSTNNYSPETIADAGLARDVVVNALNDAEAMRIVVDGTQITRDGSNIKTMFNTELYGSGFENEARRTLDTLFDSYTKHQRPGFNTWGQDAYGRCISAVYVKIKGKWINLNKLVIADTNKTEINKYNDGDQASTVINLESYEYDKKAYADSLYADTSKFDDREQVQKRIFGQTWKSLKDWTVTIGDVTLFVPPTSIRTLTQTKAERTPLIRAKGSMAKSGTKNQRIIEMDLYFSESRGINGYEYKTNTRPDNKGKSVTYWMNGLRALYAQFRVAPFLPIESYYINTVLGVDAVSLINFSCETVPNFPKLIKATIQLSEFEYRIYMPEIPYDDGNDDDTEVRNYFSKQINYPLFRYYYQRLLQNGEELKDVKFLDKKYITSTFGNKTCLVPASFVDPYIRFYVPDKNQLEKLKKAKLERMARPNTVRNITKTELNFADEMAKVKNEIDYINTSQAPLDKVNDYLKAPELDGYILAGINNKMTIGKVGDAKTFVPDPEKTKEFESLLGEAAAYYELGLTSLKREDGQPLCQKQGTVTFGPANSDGTIYGANFSINIEYPDISEDSLNNLRTLSSVSGVASADETFVKRNLRLRMSVDFGESDLTYASSMVKGAALGKGEGLFYFDTNADTTFLNFLTEVNNKQGAGGNEDANGAKALVDFVSAATLEFEPYNDDEDFLVEAIHVSTSNTFSQITLQETSGYAPQYMGGTDVSLQISMYTQSKKAASAINALPHVSAEFARNYRLVLAAWPLKIETEFTKLFGITDVMVEACEVDTVPNYPGLYHITMTLVSVDRSLRNRESLQQKDMKNFHNLSVQGVARERRWSYTQMAEYLSEAELYPDLELPTLAELAENGFNFIRYSNNKRIYPDPDFYFTYSYVLMSQLIREAVLNSLNSDACQTIIKDTTGKEISGSLASRMGAWNRNYELSKGWDKDLGATFKNDDLIAARIISDWENVADDERDETWTIAPNVKVAMMEKRMLNRINDSSKQSYKEKNGANIHSSTTYDNADGVKQPVTGQTTETDKDGNVTELKDAPDDTNNTGLSDKDNKGNLEKLKQQQQDIKDEKATGKYSSAMHKKNEEISNRINGVIKHYQNTSIDEMGGSIGDAVQQLVAAFNTCPKYNNSHIEGVPGQGRSEIPNGLFGKIPAFLDAAADAICSNNGVDYSTDTADHLNAAATAFGGTVATSMGVGAAIGSVATPVGTVAGAAAGAAVGTVAGTVAAVASVATGAHSRNEKAPWRHSTKYRGRLKIDGIEQVWAFDDDDPAKNYKIEMLTKHATEFGYFNFKFYTPEELEDRFGYYGHIERDDTVENSETVVEAHPRTGRYLADPYYRFANAEVQENYVKRCVTDYEFAKKAFLRICMLYMQVLVSYSVFPSFSYDVMRDALTNEENMQKVLSGVEELRAKKAAEEKAKSETQKQYGTSKKYSQKKQPGAVKTDAAGVVSYVGDAIPEEAANDANKAESKDEEKGKDKAQESSDSKDGGSKASQDATASVNADKTAVLKKSLSEYVKKINENKEAMDNGKLFLMCAMGVVDGDKNFLKLLLDRKYDSLNAIAGAACGGQASPNKKDATYETRLRSFIRALAGENVIDNSLIGSGETEAPAAVVGENNSRYNCSVAAEDPTMYLVHSFYDMVVHDCRGRMLRAFPTFYMFFIDEGRKIGKFRLHDNFYNTNAISSITISKSRKNPTDVAEVVMTNFFNTFTTEDEDLNMNYTANFTDVFRSLWLPTLQSYAVDEEERRTNAPKAERFRLRPGARVHIRIGYGADASHLPISFNGMIAEVDNGDVVKLICQSDGGEICKPILLEKKASELQGIDGVGWSSVAENGDTPKNIMRSLMCLKGGLINSYMHDNGWDDVANLIGTPINPLGIYHFGNPDMAYAGDPEPIQNIFEVGLKAGSERYLNASGDDHKEGVLESMYNYAAGKEEDVATHLQFEVFGKTVWDVANICRSTDPEYYAAVRPFHLRSTLFIGRAHDYYAYDYEQQGGAWIEKRKPFQQAHIYTSLSDIIDNRLAVSPKDIKTCAIGMYEVEGFMNAKVQKKTDPQWVDAAIYPEYQKTMYVDTKLFGEGSRKLGLVSDVAGWFTNGIFNSWLDRGFDKEGDAQNHHALAVKMTISALKDAMKEMYQGSIVVIGDPTVQPNDRMILNDTYNYINGQCLVRDVVQVFSCEEGFRTVITPDLITTQVGAASAGESKTQSLGCLSVNSVVGTLGAICGAKLMQGAASGLFKSLQSIKNGENAAKVGNLIKSTGSAINESKVVQVGKNVLGGFSKFGNALSKIGSVARAVSTVASGVEAAAGAVAGGAEAAAAAITAGGAATAAALAAPLVPVFILGLGAIEDIVASKFNSRKTLVIFPLMKYNKPYVGGIDGHVGSVYGAPNFGSEDAIQSIFTTLSDASNYPYFSKVVNALFGKDGIMDISQSFGLDECQKIANDEGLAQNVYRQINSSQINNFSKASFNPLKPRMSVRSNNAMQKAQALYGVTGKTPDAINADTKMKEMKSVIHDETLKQYFTNGFFRVAAHEKGFTADISDKIKCICIKNPDSEEYYYINAIFDSNGCYDIPFVHKEAAGVLHDIVVRSFVLMAGTEQERDAYKWYEDNKGSFITLTSALKCGSSKNYESTGFSFVLTASDDKSKKALSSAIDFINRQMAETHNEMEAVPEAVMTKKETGQDVFVVVHPPQR